MKPLRISVILLLFSCTFGVSAEVADASGQRRAIDVPLSAEERAWLAGLPVLRVGIDPTASPLSMDDRQGDAQGLAIDYLSDALGALGVRYTSVPTADWPETVRRAVAGGIDVLPAASPRNGELASRFDFTRPYIEFPVMIVSPEDFATISGPHDLAGRRVSANLSQGAVAAAVAHLPQVHVLDVRTAAEGLKAVASGDADAYVGDIATAEFMIRRDYPARLKLAAPADERAALAIAVSRRYAPLRPLLDRALARMPERRAQAIRNTWLRSEYTWEGSWREILRKVGPAAIAVLALLLAVTHAYLRLRLETRRRQRTEAQLADVTRHMPAVVYRFLYHANGQIEFTYVGGNPEPIFDLHAETFFRDERAAFSSIDPRDRAPLMDTVAQAAATLTPMHAEMRIHNVTPERWVASHALPRRVGDAVEFTGYWIDVSERHRQSAQLAAAKLAAESATRAKSWFLATMSHEIRTPMHGVIGMLEVLGGTPLDADQRRLLGTAESSAEALLQILDDVLDFSRIEAGCMNVEPTPVDLRQLLKGVVELFAWQSERKGLDIELRIDERMATVLLVDGIRLRQVLLNLFSNAIKFTTVGSIKIGVDVVRQEAAAQRLRFTVTDTGIGVDAADIVRLFAPFSQAEASTTRRFGGSGLGLAISRRLVELMGGTIAMTSTPGRGTCVTVELDTPIDREYAIPASPAPTAIMPAVTPLDVVVAEDHPTNRELVAAQLDRLGHRYRIAADGVQALEMATSGHADVLLTDLHMPALDGYALARALRERGARLRIVAMTANALAGERDRCLAAGMDDFITKPVRLDALARILASAMPAQDVPAPWDLDAWRDAFGDLGLLPPMVARFAATTRDDLAAIASSHTAADVAERLHRMVGGMRIFGEAPETSFAEALEHELREGDAEAAMQRLDELTDAMERYLVRLHEAMDRIDST